MLLPARATARRAFVGGEGDRVDGCAYCAPRCPSNRLTSIARLSLPPSLSLGRRSVAVTTANPSLCLQSARDTSSIGKVDVLVLHHYALHLGQLLGCPHLHSVRARYMNPPLSLQYCLTSLLSEYIYSGKWEHLMVRMILCDACLPIFLSSPVATTENNATSSFMGTLALCLKTTGGGELV